MYGNIHLVFLARNVHTVVPCFYVCSYPFFDKLGRLELLSRDLYGHEQGVIKQSTLFEVEDVPLENHD